ncbi:hypothetical protein BH10PLA2_BH10PLA2_11950 [soil metagenome]
MNIALQASRRLAVALVIGTSISVAPPVRAQEPPKNAGAASINLNKSHVLGELPIELYYRLNEANVNLAARQFLVTDLLNATDELFGASLRPIDDVLRSQLKIPAKEGLLVTSLKPAGPSAQAGLQQNDVLLTLAGKSLTSSDDVTEQLKQAGQSAISLKLLRAGKPITIKVQPLSKFTFAPVSQAKTEYYLGVSLEPVEEALRAQLKGLPGQNTGVVVSAVSKDSPAEKIGVQKHDVIIGMDDYEVTSPEMFAQKVQELKDKPTELRLLRAGTMRQISITPAVRKVETAPATQDFFHWALVQPQAPELWQPLLTKTGTDEAGRLDQLEKELKSLRDAVNKLTEALKKSKSE